MWDRVGKAGAIHSNIGCGFPRQKLERVQVALRSNESRWLSLIQASSGWSAPWLNTKSRHFVESPAIFPSAQTACIQTSLFMEMSLETTATNLLTHFFALAREQLHEDWD